jgi:DNA transposition AAA+ family ATPase
MKEKVFDQKIYNIILIHTARTWERVRVKQPHQEMPIDNIGSTECIEGIANTINDDDVIQEFLETRDGSLFERLRGVMSDAYIESLAEQIIRKNFID